MNVDLGDNYPRGIVLHVNRKEKMIYSFKTEHGDKPQNSAGVPFPLYDEISTAEKQFYKWSNDNNVYTELANPAVLE